MILFAQDWGKYPNAIIDYETSNESFLRLAALYRDMGIKNHAFILQLHNRDLQNVNPYSPDLTIDQMISIGIECKLNPFYFFRECIRSPMGTPDYPIKFRANRGNMALFWLFFNHITTCLIQIRQTGKSFSADVLMTLLLNIMCTKTTINLLTKDDTLRTSNLERLKNIELELPPYLKQRNKSDLGNTEELTIKSLGNNYKGHLPNRSPKLALNVGRGLTSAIFQVDELAFFANIEISLPAALAAGTAARDMAKIKNEPYGTIFTTTAGKIDDRDGSYAFRLVNNSAIWTEKFFDCKEEKDLALTVRRNSTTGELRVNCTFNHTQLGYTDEWLKIQLEDSLSTGEDADRDFFNIWTNSTASSPIPRDLADNIRNSQINDPYMDVTKPYGYILRWYLKESEIESFMQTKKISMGLDTSDAIGRDDIALEMRDVANGDIIASGNFNETNLITFSEWLCNLLIQYTNITLIIERRSSGSTIIDYLLLMLPTKGVDPFTRIFNKVVQEAEEFPERWKEVNKPLYMKTPDLFTKYKKYFGFATSGTGYTSRTELYSTTLLTACKYTSNGVRDVKTINQLLALEVKNGRIDHNSSGNDDLCIAWLLSYWLIGSGKNLNYYGINQKEILSKNNLKIVENNPVAVYENDRAAKIKNEIEVVSEKIKNEKDHIMISRYESILRSLVNQLPETDQQILSVEELIKTLKDSRNKTSQFNYKNYNYFNR